MHSVGVAGVSGAGVLSEHNNPQDSLQHPNARGTGVSEKKEMMQ